MKTILGAMAILALAVAAPSLADQRRFVGIPRGQSSVTGFAAPGSRIVVQRQVVPVYHYYYYYPAYPPPVLVLSPYTRTYVLPPAVVVATAPFFCALHNDGFVSRVGMLDHLAGSHRIGLDAAATICPDGAGSCLFPSY